MMTRCPEPNGGAVSPIRARDAEGASAGFGGDSRRACAPASGGNPPFGGVIEEGCEAVEPSTREARFGRGVGLMLAGIYTAFTGANGEVLGGLTTATGVGATIGVPAMAVSTTLVIGGFTNA